jgi:phage-related protein
MSGISAGVISLDLVIKDKLGEQLEKIKSSVRSPAEKIGETIRANIEEPIKNVGKTAAKTVSQAVENAGKSIDNGVEDAIKRLLEREEQQRKAMLEAANSIPEKAASSGEKYMKYNTAEITKQSDEFAEAIGKPIRETVEKANKKLAEFGKFEVSSDPVARLRQEIDLTNTQMNLLQKKWQELSTAEPSNKITAQLAATEQKIISTQNKIDKLHSSLMKLSEPSGVNPADKQKQIFEEKIMSIREKNAAKIRQIEEQNSARITAIEEQNAAKIQKINEKTTSKSNSIIKSAFGKIKTVGSKALGTLGKAAGSIGSRFKNLGKSVSSVTKPVSKLGKALKTTFKNVFLIAGIYAAFRAIKNGLIEAANADEEFSKSLNAVKANLSIAFTPILQAIMPALNTLMSGLASVTRSVAGFISGLFGTTYKQAAEATKKLKSVSDSAKKAKLSTAGIDEMNILSGDNGDSSSGSEKQGIDYGSIDMSEPELPDWAERLKDSIRSGDWAGVGAILAERVNSVLGSINWEKIQSKVNSGIGKITDGINGFLDNINWETLGDTLAGGLNTITGAINTFYSKVKWDKLGGGIANGLNQTIKKTDWKQFGKAFSARIQAVVDTAYSFVTTFDWSGFGNAFGTAVNGWFDGIDFGKAGRTLSEGIKGFLDSAINAVQTINWRQIGSKIAEFIGSIDFSGIARKFFTLLGSALGAGVSFIWGALENLVKSIGEYFSGKIDECGGNVALGLLKGIADGLLSVGKWIKDNIFKPFIEGFKKAFGIHSPSKEMAVMGGYIVDGLFNAISDGIAKIKEIFTRMLKTIKEVFSKIDDWFKEKFSAAWDKIKEIFKGVGGWFSDRWDDIKGAFSAVGAWFGEIFRTAWDNIKSVFAKPGEFFSEVWEGIKSCFSHVTSWFRDTFSEAWQAVKDVFSRGGEIFGGIVDSISEVFKGVVNSLIDGINWVIAQPFNAINSALDGIRNVEIFDWEPFSWLPSIDIPEIPKLANGGLAAAPTLAMVGDNRNAAVDPEVIAPLSKLQGMLGGDNSEIIELLKVIVQLLKGGLSAEIIGSVFGSDFRRAVLKICADDKSRRFG